MVSDYAKRILAVLNQTIASRIKRRETAGFTLRAEREVVCGVEVAVNCPMGQSYDTVRRHLHKIEAYCGYEVELEDFKRVLVFRVIVADWPMPLRYNPADLREDSLLIGYDRYLQPVYHPLNISVLTGGASGAGKTDWIRWVTLQLYLQGYEIRICDLKGVSFFPFEDHMPGIQVADEFEDAVDLIRQTYQDYRARKAHIKRLRDRNAAKDFRPILLIIDEAADLAPSQVSEQDKKDAKEADHYIGALGRLGREFKVLVLYCTQRPSAEVINKQFKSNVAAKICFRTLDDYNSTIILGHAGAEHISPETPGRFIYSFGTEQLLQTPYIGDDDDWRALLEPLNSNVEVISHGSSKRAESPRTYHDRDDQSADRHYAADSQTISEREPIQNREQVYQSTGFRWSPNLRLAQAGQSMAAHTRREAEVERITDEI